ncbi:MAG: hypothetical protein QG592_362 [Pseudomonadota bacterium]|jgi:hypothetical protein|nr:hypothetical protein [Pseudomonadota bacterium]
MPNITITILATIPDGMFSQADALMKINKDIERIRTTLAGIDSKATISVTDGAGRKA